MSKLLPIILVVIVLVGQGVIAYLFLPSASEIAAVANGEPAAAEAEAHNGHGAESSEGHDAHAESGHGEHGEEGHDGAVSETTEVDLGEFKITVFQPAANTTLFVDFHVSGVVKTAQAEEFKHLFETHKFKLRDQVNVIIRSAGIEDFTDAGLGLLKNQILERTNRTFGKPLLLSVAFPDFSFIEQ